MKSRDADRLPSCRGSGGQETSPRRKRTARGTTLTTAGAQAWKAARQTMPGKNAGFGNEGCTPGDEGSETNTEETQEIREEGPDPRQKLKAHSQKRSTQLLRHGHELRAN
jgi:hypothetical protein